MRKIGERHEEVEELYKEGKEVTEKQKTIDLGKLEAIFIGRQKKE